MPLWIIYCHYCRPILLNYHNIFIGFCWFDVESSFSQKNLETSSKNDNFSSKWIASYSTDLVNERDYGISTCNNIRSAPLHAVIWAQQRKFPNFTRKNLRRFVWNNQENFLLCYLWRCQDWNHWSNSMENVQNIIAFRMQQTYWTLLEGHWMDDSSLHLLGKIIWILQYKSQYLSLITIYCNSITYIADIDNYWF